MSAVKAFLTKIKPEFAELPVVFVKAIRFDPKLLLSVECAKAKQLSHAMLVGISFPEQNKL
jgi:hypothetical protein